MKTRTSNWHGLVIAKSNFRKSLNHVGVNLKSWFLIKSRYYIVPSPSTALLYVFTVYLFAFFSREVVVTYHVSQLLSHLHTYSQCFNLRIYFSHDTNIQRTICKRFITVLLLFFTGINLQKLSHCTVLHIFVYIFTE